MIVASMCWNNLIFFFSLQIYFLFFVRLFLVLLREKREGDRKRKKETKFFKRKEVSLSNENSLRLQLVQERNKIKKKEGACMCGRRRKRRRRRLWGKKVITRIFPRIGIESRETEEQSSSKSRVVSSHLISTTNVTTRGTQ